MTQPRRSIPDAATTPYNTLGDILSAIEPTLMIPDRLVEPDSWAGHIPFAFWITAMLAPKRYVELGVHTGNSYCAVAQTVARYGLHTECFGIDHWFGDEQAGLYGEDVYADLKSWHDPRYAHFSRLLRMSFEDGRAHVADGTVDILHIDGLHTYEAVRTDFETWRSKMSCRGIVLFHDTNVHRDDFGVWQYWQEMRAQYPTWEFLHSNGLGVAYVGSQPVENLPPLVAALFALDKDDSAVAAVRDYFARLGDSLTQEIRLGDTRRRGEIASRELRKAYIDLKSIDCDRAVIAADRDLLKERALKWDQLAVRTGGAISLDLDDVSAALALLYNSDNPQARRDRSILKRQLVALIRSGTLDPRYKDLLLGITSKLGKRVKARLTNRVAPPEDPVFEAIRASGLFDEHQYVLSHEARAAGQEPLEHYLSIGEATRIAPSAGFDPDYYARRQPDVADSGFGLLRHYVQFGQHESRHPLAPAQRMAIPSLPESGRQRVLLALHDASASDAVVLAWNVARILSDTHYVVALFEEGGPLRGSFDEVCHSTIDLPLESDIHAIDRIAIANRLATEVKPAFAIMANDDVREYARDFTSAGIGVVQLVQNFANSIRPSGRVYNFLPWVQRLVFPSEAVADTFKREHPYLSHRGFDVLWPHKTLSPTARGTSFGADDYDASVRRRLRPLSHERDFLVVGVGDVSLRAGTDLFVAVAAAVGAASTAKRPLRFVWIGGGFDAKGADEFSGLLIDQIARSGVEDRFEIVPSLDELNEVFRQADLFALTARLDALPGAAANALTAGVPVVCFDGTNSLAEYLSKAGDATAPLVTPYLDIAAMAKVIQHLADDENALAAAREAVRQVESEGDTGIETYVASLVRLGEEAKLDAEAVAQDYASIKAGANGFSEAVYGGTWPADTHPQDLLKTYLLRWRIATSAGTMPPYGLRRPLAGFNPVIYAEDALKGDLSVEPLTRWLTDDRPQGRWTHRVIALTPNTPTPATGVRVLLHGHFYYVDLVDDFLTRLNSNSSTIDLILTVPDEGRAEAARQSLERQPVKGEARVEVVANVGRDIGPFLNSIGYETLARYDIVGHVHGKKSPHVEAVAGDQWRTFLWEHLVGGRTAAADICLEAMATDPKLGLVFPEDAHIHGWDANLDVAAPLARKMGRTEPLPAAFEWPMGTMFWARPAALEPLFKLDLKPEDYPKEPLPGDGTLLHALERLVPFAAEQAGFSYATSHIEEVQR